MLHPTKLRLSSTSFFLLISAVFVGALLVFMVNGSAAKGPEPNTTHETGESAPNRHVKVAGAYGKLPLSFEANAGQAHRRVRFIARGVGYGLFLTSDETVLALRSGTLGSDDSNPGTLSRESYKALRMKLVGARSRPSISGVDELPGKLNYFIGNDPRKWRNGVSAYSKVKYRDVYPGVDVVYHGSQGQLEYDFVIAPGRSPRRIKMAFKGMESITVDPDGTLVLRTAAGDIRQPKPIAYQDVDGVRQEVEVRYKVRGNEVSFEVGTYDSNHTLVIDPVLIYSTFLGGTSGDQGLGIAVDAQGSAYLTGSTTSMDFPLAGAFQNTLNSFGDAFVVKLNPAGTALIYSTYLGGDSDEIGHAVAVDSQGSAYVVGTTFSGTFPVTPGAFQDTKDGSVDAFVTKLSPSGSSLSYSTYLGGDHSDVAYGIAVSSDSRAYVVGRTESTRFRTLPFPTPRNGSPAYKSTNGAVEWFPSGSGLTSSVVNGFGFDPNTANTLYAATNLGVFKSADAAASWSLTGTASPSTAPQSANVVVIDPSNPNIIYAAAAFEGVYKSTDGGNTYTVKNNGFQVPFVNALAIDPTTPTTLYAGTAFGMYKTTNGGDSWVELENGFIPTTPRVNEVVIDPTNSAIVYVGTSRGIFKTTNGGALWTPDNSGVLSFTQITALAIDPLNPSTLYAGGFLGGIFKTTDGGATWSASNTGIPATAINALAIDPLTPMTLYAATTGSGIFKSTNGGANWTQGNTGLGNATVNSVGIVSTNPAILYAGTFIGGDAFAVKLDPSGSTLEYLLNFGGNENDEARGVGLGADGNAYIVGSTNSPNFPVLNAFQSAAGGLSDAFVAKLNSSGTGFIYSTYLGGNGSDQGRGIAVRSESAHVVGQTTSSNFPLVNAIKSTLAQFDTDAFVTKLNPAGSGADFSTFLGGGSTDQGFGVAVDADGNIYVTGGTRSSDFPTLGAPQPTFGGGNFDAFVTKLNAAGTSLIYSTYLGGTSTDQGNGIATDGLGNTYVVGVTSSNNFPIANPFQSTLKSVDAFVTKLGPGVELALTMTDLPDPVAFGSDLTYTINVRNNGELPATNVTLTDTLPAGAMIVSTASTRGTCTVTSPTICAIGTLNAAEVATVTIVIKPPAVRTITNTASVSLTENDPVPSNNTATVDTLVDFANLSVVKKAAHILVAPGANLTYTLNVRNLDGITSQSVTVSDNLPSGTTLVGCAATGGVVCGGAGNNVSVTFPSLAVGASEAITITVNVSGTLTAGTVIANTANVSSALVDPDPQNNSSTASVTVSATPIIQRSNGLIAFAADRAFTPVSEPSGIYTINSDATGESPFQNIPQHARLPSWSPDGARLAFQHTNFGTPSTVNEISVINADGSGLLKVAENLAASTQRITWSPGGAHLAFIGNGQSNQPETQQVIFVAHTDGSGTYRLPNSPTLLKAVDWSPDGSKFVYATDRELFLMNADGSSQTQLTTIQQTPDGPTADSHPRWSPDGSKIMFTRSSNNNRDLYSINSDGSGFTRLLNINQTAEGSWSPDGTKVVFSQANEIFTIDAIGAKRRLTDNIYYDFSPDWQPIENSNPTPTPTPGPFFTISGRITNPDGTPSSGAIVRLAGLRTGAIGANGDGNYTFVNLPQGGKYTVTPTSAFAKFVPGSRTVDSLQQNQTGLDFVSTPVMFGVRGRITDTSGNGLGGLGVSLLRFGSRIDTTTDGQGFYSFANVFPGDGYSVMAQSTGFSFDPGNAFLGPVFEDTTVNFVAAPVSLVHSIRGRIIDTNSSGSLSGLVVTLSGARQSVTKTSDGGNFEFANLPTGQDYTITPSAAGGFVFLPPQQTFTNLTTDHFTGFSATIPQPRVQFSAANYTVGEGGHFVDITATRSGTLSAAGIVDYETSDLTGSERTDYTAAFGTLRFAQGEASKSFIVFVTDDALVEGERTFGVKLTNGSGIILGSRATATVTIMDDDSAPSEQNPVQDASFFVRQHYADFLNRAPDDSGLAFWTDQITSCGADAQCRELRRINVSAAFFLSIEFQQTGYLVYRLNQAAFNTGEKLKLRPFLSDTQEIGRGVAVGIGNWEQQLEANKQSFINDFVLRQEFTRVYPLSMGPSQFVDMLNANTGGSLTTLERDALIADLTSGTKTRAQVLRAVAENAEFGRRQFNRAFVIMQYFGYLRRTPDDPPDSDFAGWQFWLNKLDQFNGNFVEAEMVKAFITSGEYTHRFGR